MYWIQFWRSLDESGRVGTVNRRDWLEVDWSTFFDERMLDRDRLDQSESGRVGT